MNTLRLFLAFLPAAFLTVSAGCGKKEKPAPPANTTVLQGAGATFPNPVYQKWIAEYVKEHPQVSIAYDSVGSGKGIDRFMKKDVDFGASDGAMSDDQIKAVSEGVQLMPTMGGMVVLAYNPKDLPKNLKLSRDVYVDIFLGKITNWSDKRIKELNPDHKFPSTPIGLAVRQDSSGTTFAFTNHLAAVSPEWKKSPGVSKLPTWPTGVMKAAGNDGVGGLIQSTPGAIGYMEYGLAKRLGLPLATLQNKAGEYVAATGGTGLAALLEAKLPDNFRAFIPDPEDPDSYPIITYTWIMAYKKHPTPAKGQAVRDFLEWTLTDGQKDCETLGFVRLPPSVARRVLAEVRKIQ